MDNVTELNANQKNVSEASNSILIIDDEKSSINVLAHILRQNHTIYTARDGKTGLEIANEFLPDIILLDIIMPEMDGYKVLSELKSSPKTRHIPVIFVTGLDSSENIKNDIASETADCIYKPFNAADVKEKVDKQIQIIRNRM